MNETTKPIKDDESEKISFSDFLERVPPLNLMEIEKIAEEKLDYLGKNTYQKLFSPEIQLHCTNELCNGMRFFRCSDKDEIKLKNEISINIYLNYLCSNCRKSSKTFSLLVKKDAGLLSGSCIKYGELPNYGPPTSAKLIKLLGPDREIFLKGRRCENLGLGIGAFVYYRRVIENQKNRILDEIIKVASKINSDQGLIEALEKAKNETQFSKAIDSIKKSFPDILLINGNNPLTLLHAALSEGIHNQTDEHCLGIATSIRVLLSELSDRLSQILKDEAELNKALTTLMKVKQT